jgi:hypothetical protein
MFPQTTLTDNAKKGQRCGSCGTYGGGEVKCRRGFCGGKSVGKNHLKDLDIDGRTVLKLMLQKGDGKALIGLMWLGIGRSVGLL